MSMWPTTIASIVTALTLGSGLCYSQINVLTYHNDNSRTGQSLSETVLTPATVKAGRFGKLFEVKLDGKVDAQPLHVGGLNLAGGIHNIVLAATEHDSVYAFDADNGKIYWHTTLLKSGETTSDNRGCGQVSPEIGVTATPVIDRSAGPQGTVYVVAMSKDSSGNYYQRLHALDLVTGAEQFGGPVEIEATYPGSGANSSDGRVVFDPKQYKDRAALLLLNGVVYTSWGSHCDIPPYTGWIIGYDRLSLHQTSVFNFAPNGEGAALWNSGGGPAADAHGNIFVAVANGTFDTKLNAQGFPNAGDYGNAFLKLAVQGGQMVPLDYWTMDNSTSESAGDADLGSGGIMLLPDVQNSSGTVFHLAVGAGKDGNLWVVNRDNMGKFDSTSNHTIYQQLNEALPGSIWSNPAYFDNFVYYGSVRNVLQAFEVKNARLLLPASSTTSHSFPYPGVSPSVSANGTQNAIVWAVENSNPAVLHAYDATNLAKEYYNSSDAASDQFGAGNKFIAPTIASGEVFVGTPDSVAVFGLLPATVLPNGEYTIANQLTNLALEDPGSSNTSGVQIQGAIPNGATNQKWIFTSDGHGFYTIRNAASGLLLTDPGGSKTFGTKLEQQTANGSDPQLWSLTISGSGYVLRNKASALVADNTNYRFTPGTGMQLWSATGRSNQTWLVY
ncbi:MAG: RICIN domain-containing protein [Acidobacteriaceae bacterium]|nr:RICIN domain-containing protein [Acidobacteriaceae bacterium]